MNEIALLKAQVAELLEWKRSRQLQQIAYPLDDQSKNIVGAVTYEGTGSTALTDSINLTGAAETINVPKAYADTILVVIGDTRVEIPVISFP